MISKVKHWSFVKTLCVLRRSRNVQLYSLFCFVPGLSTPNSRNKAGKCNMDRNKNTIQCT